MSIPINQIILGDCIEAMNPFPDNSIDCIVTDPPYGLNFMGKEWDKALPPKTAFVEMCRVLKPGALAFVMSSPRQDLMWRMAQLLEESGFELGQSFLSHIFASGFPKAYDMALGIDVKFIREQFFKVNRRQPTREELKQLLREKRSVLGHYRIPSDSDAGNAGKEYSDMPIDGNVYQDPHRDTRKAVITEPASDEAKKWSGYKSVSGLKPAIEVIFMVQKPLSEKTIVDNVLRWGTGAMNVNACRIPIEGKEPNLRWDQGNWDKAQKAGTTKTCYHYEGVERVNPDEKGRFPANLLISDDALNDGKEYKTGDIHPYQNKGKSKIYGNGKGYLQGSFRNVEHQGDSGSFSRYFDLDAWAKHHGFLNVPKADTREREYGLYLGEKKEVKTHGETKPDLSGKSHNTTGQRPAKRRNIHVTVKPVALMAYLIELGCPPGGVVLDPFLGSGTTCVAAKKLNRRYIGIEIDPEIYRIAQFRVAAEPVKLDIFSNEPKP